MNIVAFTQYYLPDHNAGSEAMMHDILVGLSKIGHQIKIVCQFPSVTEHEGFEIYDYKNPYVNKLVSGSDIVLTHLDATKTAYEYANKNNKPIAMIVHNDRTLEYNRVYRDRMDLLVFNSQWLFDETTHRCKSLIVNPPLVKENYLVSNNGDAITLINMNERKGGNLFWELAARMPEQKFIGVLGAYGDQVLESKIPANVTIEQHTPNIKDIYAKTKILIMPSSYETWGKTAMEASISGIPVIAHPTNGLKECLGRQGIFANRDNPRQWVNKINDLLDEDNYKTASNNARARAEYVSELFEPQIKALSQAMLSL